MNGSDRRLEARMTAEALAESGPRASVDVGEYALGLGDDALVLAHRLGEWIARAPELEEDVALGNIGLDLLGHARVLLTYAGSAWGRTEDDLAYFRDEPQFRCLQLFEQPRGDFAVTIARQLVASVYFVALYEDLERSADPVLAAIAAKAVKEVRYHFDHSSQWLLRLGLGTEVSSARMQSGLDAMWPYVDELFRPWPAASALPGVAVEPPTLRERFDGVIPRLIASAGLTLPQVQPAAAGGRSGVHSEALGPMLAEMQVLARAHPGAVW